VLRVLLFLRLGSPELGSTARTVQCSLPWVWSKGQAGQAQGSRIQSEKPGSRTSRHNDVQGLRDDPCAGSWIFMAFHDVHIAAWCQWRTGRAKACCGLERPDPTADAKAGPDDGCGELTTNRIGFYGGDSSRGFPLVKSANSRADCSTAAQVARRRSLLGVARRPETATGRARAALTLFYAQSPWVHVCLRSGDPPGTPGRGTSSEVRKCMTLPRDSEAIAAASTADTGFNSCWN
jgi:hypothetical protein